MATQLKNLMFLMLTNNYIGATIELEEGTKVIEDILDYDSLTHVFIVQFTNGDIQQISDKLRVKVILADAIIDSKVRVKPNIKRAKP